MNVRSWLRRVPQPSSLRCDGKKTIQVGQGKNKWRDAVQTLEALQPSLVEALNEDGAVIRVAHLNDDDDQGDAKAPLPSEGQSEQAQLAALILEATDRGAQRHADAYALAFGKMTDLVGILANRLQGLEVAWQKTLEARAADLAAAAPADQAEAGIAGLLASVVASQASPPAPNGKRKES